MSEGSGVTFELFVALAYSVTFISVFSLFVLFFLESRVLNDRKKKK